METSGDPTQGPKDGVTPYLTVVGGKRAVDFYTQAFAAEEVYRNVADDGERLLHARMRLNGGWLMLSDHFAEMMGGGAAPKPAGTMLHLRVDDADAWWERALAAGATVKHPIADQFWGDRFGVIEDPFGHSWGIGGPIKGK